MFNLRIVALCATVFVGTTGQTAFCMESVAYEWSATLSRLQGDDPLGADPLGIGNSEVPFTWRAVVSSDETDTINVAVRVANYQNAQVYLWLDGFAEPLVSTSAYVEIWDEPSSIPRLDPGVDTITSRGQFEYQGVTFSVQTGAAVPRDAFDFATAIAKPPVFEPTVNTLSGTSGLIGWPYFSRLSVGAPVTATLVVPEPTTAALVSGVAVAAFGRRRAR